MAAHARGKGGTTDELRVAILPTKAAPEAPTVDEFQDTDPFVWPTVSPYGRRHPRRVHPRRTGTVLLSPRRQGVPRVGSSRAFRAGGQTRNRHRRRA